MEWKDNTTNWVDLDIVKEANPIELAEYAVANKIDDEPAFAWWVAYTLKKRERIISKVKSKYWKTSHKYGVRLPKSAEEALRIEKESETDYWEGHEQRNEKKLRYRMKKLKDVHQMM